MLALVLVGVVPFSLYALPTMFRSLFVLDTSGIMWVALFATMWRGRPSATTSN